ncbi:hypothetical protein BV25DRAFT_381883 [Artomyces pyxidatus]|uniref:Uncharacterized protein n=1 Tax=Artomyces pyxidatus TaxID=48021 RepID=A0ACB8T525_9AGAM|nr:hypothetical protein BV25DRAFT_381883 [Artomyces pyxidatus]
MSLGSQMFKAKRKQVDPERNVVDRERDRSTSPDPRGSLDDRFEAGSSSSCTPEISLEGSPVAHSTLTSNLADRWDQVKDGPRSKSPRPGSKFLDSVEGLFDDLRDKISAYAPIGTPTNDGIDDSEAAKVVEDRIDNFFDGLPVFMNALDAVANLHPFIGVVVLAFKAVVKLEEKRRDNEKKVIALYVEMQDMMSVLLQLQDVRDDKLVAPDHRTIEDRLKTLIEKTAEDIKLCANACDTYSKKKLLTKIIKGPMWDIKFLNFAAVFAQRRVEFGLALTLHISGRMEAATVKLDSIDDTTKEVNAKLDVLMSMFQSTALVSADQKALSEHITADRDVNGVDSVVGSLQEATSVLAQSLRRESDDSVLQGLELELAENPDDAMEQNMAVFSRKFEGQKRQIIDDTSSEAPRPGDRVISGLHAGPFDSIRNQSVYRVWKDMGWRGTVKTRQFVLGLRDYYSKMLDAADNDSVPPEDVWAMKLIGPPWVQPMVEAIDETAIGLIGAAEINRFSNRRPLNWSLQRWIAFWAVGWHASTVNYVLEIEVIVKNMEDTYPRIPHAKTSVGRDYLYCVWELLHSLSATLEGNIRETGREESFREYIEAEEHRLRRNLESIDYVIDDMDALTLITGETSIEKVVFPITYLLLQRHGEIMKTAAQGSIPSEFHGVVECLKSIFYVREAMVRRMYELRSTFMPQNLDPEKQFRFFAFGIFKYLDSQFNDWNTRSTRSNFHEADGKRTSSVRAILDQRDDFASTRHLEKNAQALMPGKEEQAQAATVEDELSAAHVEELNMSTSTAVTRTCGVCSELVGLPCWLCWTCKDHFYICNSCHAKDMPKVGIHTESHILVRCKPEEPNLGERALLESRFCQLQTTVQEMQVQFMEQLTTAQAQSARLAARVEELLDRIKA